MMDASASPADHIPTVGRLGTVEKREKVKITSVFSEELLLSRCEEPIITRIII